MVPTDALQSPKASKQCRSGKRRSGKSGKSGRYKPGQRADRSSEARLNKKDERALVESVCNLRKDVTKRQGDIESLQQELRQAKSRLREVRQENMRLKDDLARKSEPSTAAAGEVVRLLKIVEDLQTQNDWERGRRIMLEGETEFWREKAYLNGATTQSRGGSNGGWRFQR